MANPLGVSQILLTGGTGSFGKAFLAEALKKMPSVERIVVFSRDELKQWELSQIFQRGVPSASLLSEIFVIEIGCEGLWKG